MSHEVPTGSAQTTQNSAKEEDKQVPESAAPQHPKFKTTPGPQLPTRRRFLSETDELQDPQPVWDTEPQFCQGFLIQELHGRIWADGSRSMKFFVTVLYPEGGESTCRQTDDGQVSGHLLGK